MSALVSVVMGVRDAGEYLRPTLESVLGQQGVDLEFVIVDDGSRDGSSEILREYAGRDPRVRLLAQPCRGLTEALIRGCEAARGAYVARQDAADVSRPGRLARQKEALDADPRLAFVSCWTEYRGPDREYLFTSRDSGAARSPSDVVVKAADGRASLADGPSHHGSVMFRGSCYRRAGGYRSEFFLAQDRDLWFRLAEHGLFQAIPESLYVALVLPASRSSSYRAVQHRLGGLARRAFELRQSGRPEREVLDLAETLRPEGPAEAPRRLAGAHYFVGEALRRNRDPRCMKYFRRTLRADPLHAAGWVRLLQAGATTALGGWRAETPP